MIDKKKGFDPVNYDMVFCPLCNGDGKLPEDSGGARICADCGGFGLIKNGKEGSTEKQIGFRDKRMSRNYFKSTSPTAQGHNEREETNDEIIMRGFSKTECAKPAPTLGAATYIKKPFLLE